MKITCDYFCMQVVSREALLPFNRRRGFGADVVDDAVDAEDFVDDPFACLCQHFVGQARPFGGHEIDRGNRA